MCDESSAIVAVHEEKLYHEEYFCTHSQSINIYSYTDIYTREHRALQDHSICTCIYT